MTLSHRQQWCTSQFGFMYSYLSAVSIHLNLDHGDLIFFWTGLVFCNFITIAIALVIIVIPLVIDVEQQKCVITSLGGHFPTLKSLPDDEALNWDGAFLT